MQLGGAHRVVQASVLSALPSSQVSLGSSHSLPSPHEAGTQVLVQASLSFELLSSQPSAGCLTPSPQVPRAHTLVHASSGT